MEHETFFSLLRSAPHWEFELFLLVIVDGLIGLILWPSFRKRILHHQSDDQKIEALEKQVKALQERLGIDHQ